MNKIFNWGIALLLPGLVSCGSSKKVQFVTYRIQFDNGFSRYNLINFLIINRTHTVSMCRMAQSIGRYGLYTINIPRRDVCTHERKQYV